MLKIALKNKPNYVCIVPEKRTEITTEGGLNLNKNSFFLKTMIKKLKKKKIRVALFIDPNISDVTKSKELGANAVELHTGKFCNKFNNNKNSKNEFLKIKKSAFLAQKKSLEVHAGHGLTYKTAHLISKISAITEFNIGHFIIAESVFINLTNAIKNFKRIIN